MNRFANAFQHPVAGPRARPLLHWLLALLLGLQLLTSTQHHHDLFQVDNDCVACDLAMQFTGSTPALPAVVLPTLLLVSFLLVRPRRPLFHRESVRHLLPLSQAPPAAP